VSSSASGTGHNPYLEVLGTTTSDSHTRTTTTNSLTMNGTIRAGILHEQTLSVDASGHVTQTPETAGVVMTTVSPREEIQAEIARLQDALEEAETPEERDQIQGQIEALQLLLDSVHSGPVNALLVGDILAAGGNVIVDARSISGHGSVTAYGAPKITITNASPFYLSLNRLTIPDQDPGGEVRFTGVAGRAAAQAAGWQLNEIGAGQAPRIEVSNTYDAGAGIGPAILLNGPVSNLRGLVKIFNQSGSLAQFAEVRAQQIQIDVPNGSFIVNQPTGTYWVSGEPSSAWAGYEFVPGDPTAVAWLAANAWASERDGPFSTDLELNRYLRDPDRKMNGPTPGGRTIVVNNLPNCYSLPGFNLGCRQSFSDIQLFNGFWMERVPLLPLHRTGDYDDGQHIGKTLIFGGQVGINARYIDINGTIRSGRPGNWSLRINPEAEAWVRTVEIFGQLYGQQKLEMPQEFAGHTLWETLEEDDQAPTLYYNLTTGQFEVGDVNAAGGGFVFLHGQIMSTNKLGKIEVLDGFGDVQIENLTGRTLAVQNIDTGRDTVGVVKIVDTAKRTADGNALTTWYVYRLGEGLSVYDNRNGATDYANAYLVSQSAQNVSTYQPLQGQRYEWTRTATVRRMFDRSAPGAHSCGSSGDPSFYRLCQPSEWRWAEIPDPSAPNNPWTFTSRVTTGNDPNLPYFVETVSGSLYNFDVFSVDFADENKGVPTEGAEGHDWWYWVARGAQVSITSSIKADNPIAIAFSGNETGRVRIDSHGDIALAGRIENSFGETNLQTLDPGAAITQNASARINTQDLEMSSAAGIGTLVQPIIATLNGGSLRAESQDGDIVITVPSGSVQVERIEARRGAGFGTVRLTADRDIGGEVPGSQVVGAYLYLESENGAIGSAQAPLEIRAVSTTHADGSISGGELSARAAGDIYLAQAEGDLRLVEAVSQLGDVGITVRDGRLINAQRNRAVDAERQAQLAEIWDKLHISAEHAAIEDALATTVRPYELSVTQTYHEYWRLRQHGAVEAGVFTLDAEAIPLYAPRAAAVLGVSDPTPEQVQAYARDVLSEYEAFFSATFGTDWAESAQFVTYDPGWVYTAPPEKVAELTRGAAWLTSQLIYEINQNALLPGSGTHFTDQAPNVAGRSVSLTATSDDGSIGSLAPSMLIELPTTPGAAITLSDEQKAALAAANLPGDVTVERDSNGRPVRIAIRQTEPIFIEASGQLDVLTSGDAFIRSPESVAVARLQAGGNIQLLVDGDITNAAPAGAAAIVGDKNLALEASTGSIGTAAAPLTFDIGGVIGTARAAGELNLARLNGDLRFEGMFAGDAARLHAPDGGIYAQKSGVSILAGSLELNAAGDVAGNGGALAIGLSPGGLLSGDVGGHLWLSSPGTGLSIGDLRTGRLTLDGGSLRLQGAMASAGPVLLTSTGSTNMAEGASLATTGASVSIQAAEFVMDERATIGTGSGDIMIETDGGMQVSWMQTTGAVALFTGGTISQTRVGGIQSPELLTTMSRGGQSLQGSANALRRFEARNDGGGAIRLINGSVQLTLGDVRQLAGGDVFVAQSGSLLVAKVTAPTGTVSLGAGGAISNGDATQPSNVNARNVQLFAQGGGVGQAGQALVIDSSYAAAGTVTVSALGDIHLTEAIGDLNLNQVFSGGGDVTLTAAGSILNRNSTGGLNVQGNSLTLAALGGGIGETGTALAIDSSHAAAGVVTGSAVGDIYLSEANGDLHVNEVLSDGGDVTLTAAGSILSRNSTGGVNVQGNNLTLAALGGGIGEGGAALAIDSSHAAAGIVTASALGGIYLAEMNNDLNVNQILSDGGDVTLTAAGAILNRNSSGDVNVQGNNLTLAALGGGIGETGTALAIDSSHAAAGVATASALGDIYLSEANGDLHVNEVLSDGGDVTLTA
ncbi:MAG TPA: hypothetical protein VF234_04215, partial [Limnochordia bacterium]